jgi:8-oxo-dGTP diphosphatase
MLDATLCFLIRGNPPDEILLGFKKTGLGAGKYGGFGGKVETGEKIITAAARELEEETSIRVLKKNLWYGGHLTFLFPAKPAWSQVVHVFVARTWDGDPTESAEMKPAWFKIDDIPFERMWQDCAHWLPHTLAGQQIRASFTFQQDNETIETFELETWDDDSPNQ